MSPVEGLTATSAASASTPFSACSAAIWTGRESVVRTVRGGFPGSLSSVRTRAPRSPGPLVARAPRPAGPGTSDQDAGRRGAGEPVVERLLQAPLTHLLAG